MGKASDVTAETQVRPIVPTWRPAADVGPLGGRGALVNVVSILTAVAAASVGVIAGIVATGLASRLRDRRRLADRAVDESIKMLMTRREDVRKTTRSAAVSISVGSLLEPTGISVYGKLRRTLAVPRADRSVMQPFRDSARAIADGYTQAVGNDPYVILGDGGKGAPDRSV
jgi:hypothetical protein